MEEKVRGSLRESSRPWGPFVRDKLGGGGGGDGKLCVYVLQEEALQAGGNTRASISVCV